MKQLLVLAVLFSTSSAISQKPLNKIEIMPYMRADWYPEFSFVFNNRASTDYVKMHGNSVGLNVSYEGYLRKSFFIKSGVGYYKYSFNKIRNENTTFGVSDGRLIKYPSPLFLLFYTDKYWYNTLSLNIGIEKFFKYQNDLEIYAGVNLANYFTFSQSYHVVDNPGNKNYKKSDKRYYGLSVFLCLRLLKNFGDISIGPSLILPVYDIWKKDLVFPEENNSDFREKWINGIGLGVTCYLLLSKK